MKGNLWYDAPNGMAPKRGDLMQSNIGDKRERTWIILKAVKRRTYRNRYNIWSARWWELDAEFRMKLFLSAQRNGGQNVFPLYRYPVKKKKSFEQHMRRGDYGD